MLQRCYHRFLKIAKGVNILLLTSICGLMMIFVMDKAIAELKRISGGVGPIDTQFFYSVEKINYMLNAYGEEGRTFYMVVEGITGAVFPLIHGLLLSMLIINWFHKLQVEERVIQKLLCLPFFALVCDYLENILIITLLSSFPKISLLVVQLATLFTAAKWIFVFCSIFVCIVGAVALLLHYARFGFNKKVF